MNVAITTYVPKWYEILWTSIPLAWIKTIIDSAEDDMAKAFYDAEQEIRDNYTNSIGPK